MKLVYSPGMTEEGILKMLVANFDKKLTTDMREWARALGLSLPQAVTLASLVEKEAKLDTEHAAPVLSDCTIYSRLS